MHVHISWATALIILLSYVAVVGAINMFARSHAGSKWSQAWGLVASPN